jgi:DNA-binding LytR/AlgR family response regulator
MYRCVIIDDEPHAIAGLSGYLESVPNLQLVSTFNDSSEALRELQSSPPVDIIFLDVDMPKISGIELSREIRSKTDKLIFTTGHTQYGYEAFKVDADDYLLKPYTLGEFIIAINKLFPEIQKETGEVTQDCFLVKSKEDNNRIVSINYKSVIAVESKLNYVTIYTSSRKVTTYMSLTEMFGILSKRKGFLQFHRSFIIAYDHIDYIDGHAIRMKNGIEVTVREHFKKSFSTFVSSNLIKARSKGPNGPERPRY